MKIQSIFSIRHTPTFFLTRVLDGEKSEVGEVSEELYQVIQKKYKDTFGCVEKIADFLAEIFNYQMSTDEKCI